MFSNDKLGLEEFQQHVYDNISKIIINRKYIDENQQFFDSVLFKMWEDYHFKADNTSINLLIRNLEFFLWAMIKNKPAQELPEDEINVTE